MNLSCNGKGVPTRSARSGGLPARRSLGRGLGVAPKAFGAGEPSFLDRSVTRGNCFHYNSSSHAQRKFYR